MKGWAASARGHSGQADSPGHSAADADSREQAAAQVTAELERLRAEATAARTARDMALQELLTLQDTVNRVAAVCDMAEWAADLEGSEGPAVANVEDLRKALRPSPRPRS